MHRGMSYRKPVPAYIPSPPPSPTPQPSGARQIDEQPPVNPLIDNHRLPRLKRLKLPEHWHDAITRARQTYGRNPVPSSDSGLSCSISNDELGTHSASGHASRLVAKVLDPLPRVASPVHFASHSVNIGLGHHRLYRPPTPPRRSDHKLREPDRVNLNQTPILAEPLKPKVVAIPVRQSEGMYTWPIKTMTAEPSSRRESTTMSVSSSDWQLEEFSKSNRNSELPDQPVIWWDKFRWMGDLLKNRLKDFQHHKSLC
ncbi:hypothetical protein R3P38DRAFT_3251159 [Favolaschia claudopus]|uniref:Uncharacterized protein n=1 Tax=Favolaschia claudopus TaxID=2862362 RepID=A0AAW0EC03_9AGAR